MTEDMIPGNRPGDEHFKACPCHEDAPEAWDVHGWLVTECICSTIKAELAADRAEFKRDCWEDR